MKYRLIRFSLNKLIQTCLCLSFLHISHVVCAQTPVNDLCQNAINIGNPTLNQSVCINGQTTVGANPEYPQITLLGCAGSASGVHSSLSDVWYTVTTPPDANGFNFSLNSTMSGSIVAVYSGTCGSLISVACYVDTSSNSITGVLQPVSENTTYYIQVSGKDSADQGTFDLCIEPFQYVYGCATQVNLVSSPQPQAGSYYLGDTVTFCLTVSQFTQISANWFHGVEINFGSGWDTSSFTVVSVPASCDGLGQWGYYQSFSHSAPYTQFGPGFFYDSPSGSPNNMLDGDPGNNFGDNCTNYNWTFCWSLAVAAQPQSICNNTGPVDMSIQVYALADGYSGGWSSPGCAHDPVLELTPILSCCRQPGIVITDDHECIPGCEGQVDVIGGGTPPFNYAWSTGDTTSSLSNLCAGTYQLTVVDSTGCRAVNTVPVISVKGLNITTGMDLPACNDSSGSLWVTPGIGLSPYTYSWMTTPMQTTDTITGLPPGSYTVMVTDSLGCEDSLTIMLPSSMPLSGNIGIQPVPCQALLVGSATANISGGHPPYTYEWNTTPPRYTASIDSLGAGLYTVTVTDSTGCTYSVSAVVNAFNEPAITLIADSTCIGDSTGMVWVNATAGTAPFQYDWSLMQPTNTNVLYNLGPGVYSVTVTDANGCQVDSSISVFEYSAPLNVSGSILGLDSLYCDNAQAVSLTGSPAIGTFSGPGISGNTFMPDVAGAGLHAINYAYYDSQGCPGTTSSYVRVIASPMVSIQLTDTAFCINDTLISLNVTPFGGVLLGDGISAGYFNPLNAGTGTHQILYSYTSASGCESVDSANVLVYNCVGVSETMNRNEEIHISYSKGMIHLNFTNGFEKAEVYIFSIAGQLIKNLEVKNVDDNVTYPIDLSEFVQGVYLVRISTDKQVFVQKIILQ